MLRDRELFEDEEKSQKDVPDGLSPDADIIELVDVVREGDPLRDSDGDDLPLVLNEEERPEEEKDFLGREDEDLDGFSLSLDETSKGNLESGLDERDEAFHDPFESPDFDFETPEGFNEPTVEAVTDRSEDDLSERPTEYGDDIPDEDLDLVMAGLADEVEEKTSGADATDEALPSVSQERLEVIITQTVTEVVERVVRETVAEVAEKVIKEAIESLKHSLESRPERPLL